MCNDFYRLDKRARRNHFGIIIFLNNSALKMIQKNDFNFVCKIINHKIDLVSSKTLNIGF